MSLLMDALKRAEATKQKTRPGPPQTESSKHDSPEDLALLAIADDQPRQNSNPLPDLAAHLEAVDADLAKAAKPAPPLLSNQQPSTPEKDRHAIRNTFSVKQVKAPSKKRGVWIGLAIFFLLVITISVYFWLQLESINSVSLAKQITPTSQTPQEQIAEPAIGKKTKASPLTDEPPSVATRTSSLFTHPQDTKHEPVSTTNDTAQTNPVRLTRTSPETDPGLILGQAHLLHNEIQLAKESFEQTLRRDPNNTDALLALAAIAQRQRRPSDAEHLYQQAWIANPGDALRDQPSQR